MHPDAGKDNHPFAEPFSAENTVKEMVIEKIEKNNTICAVVSSSEILITDTQSALDVLMAAKYSAGT